MKVLLILVDGMRPDAIGNIPQVEKIKEKSTYTMEAKTVLPSVTLPCHVSLFHSVTPQRHGTTTNTYMPQVRPIQGLYEVLSHNKKTCAMFYNWEQLRDVSRSGSLVHSCCYSGAKMGFKEACDATVDAAIQYLNQYDTDFTFLYFCYPDEMGHKYGWMTPEYQKSLEESWANIEKVLDSLKDNYTVIITADHGGHDRTHGSDMKEDITIPIFAMGEAFKQGATFEEATLLDIAPTIAKLLGTDPDEEWEGKTLY